MADSKTGTAARKGLRHAQAIAGGVQLAKDLGNLPSNVCTPRYLASSARKIAARSKKASAKILGPAEMKRLGMGALLSVTAGATEPARLIVIQYRGDKPGQQTHGSRRQRHYVRYGWHLPQARSAAWTK